MFAFPENNYYILANALQNIDKVHHMKLKRKEYEIAIIVFLITFFLAFYLFGGISKLSRIKEASKVEEANSVYLAKKEEAEIAKKEMERKKQDEAEREKAEQSKVVESVASTPENFVFEQISEFDVKVDAAADGSQMAVTWSYDSRNTEQKLISDTLWGAMSDDEKAVFIVLKDSVFESLKQGVKELGGDLVKLEEGAEEDPNDLSDEDLYAWESDLWKVAFISKNDFSVDETPYFHFSIYKLLSSEVQEITSDNNVSSDDLSEDSVLDSQSESLETISYPEAFYIPDNIKLSISDITEETQRKNQNVDIEFVKKWNFSMKGLDKEWDKMTAKEQNDFRADREEFFKAMRANVKTLGGLLEESESDEDTLSQGRKDAYFDKYLDDFPAVLEWSVVIYSAEEIANGKPALYGEIYQLKLKESSSSSENSPLDQAFSPN